MDVANQVTNIRIVIFCVFIYHSFHYPEHFVRIWLVYVRGGGWLYTIFQPAMEVAPDNTSRHTRCRYMRNNKTALLITAQALPVFLSVTLLKQAVLQRLLSTEILPFHPIPPYLTYALYPISTSLLTILFRRYSVIRGSLWVICVATFGTVAVLLVDYISILPGVPAAYTYSESKPVPSTCTYITVLLALAYVLLSVGLGGFHSNIIAFGYEQMESAGAKELVTFIHLCLGLEYLGFGMAFAYAAITNNGQYVDDVIAVNLYVSLGCAAMVTIVMVLTLLCQDHMVIEEPNTPNPLKLIFKVAWYSKKVHSFHHTTTLTQGSQLAVMPFTAREVDEVKMFFRFLPIFIPLGLLIVANVAATRTAPSVFFFNFTNPSDVVSPSLLVGSYSVPYLIIPPFILMYNFVLTHVFYRRFVTILNRVTIGMILMALVLLTVVVTVAILYSTTVHMRFIILYMALSGLSGISLFLVVSAVFEFICAQSPYSMRSMMISITYATEGLGSVVGIALLLAILDPHHAATRQSWHYRPIVYYSVSAAMAVVGVMIAIFNAKRHKARRRLDKKYEDAYADRVSILSSLMSSIENFEIINQPAASYS